MKIIYQGIDGSLAVVIPADTMPIAEVARKDVPQGVPYKFVEDDVFPEDRTFRNAWEAEFAEPDGHGDPEGWWVDYWAKEAAAKAQEEAERQAAFAAANQGEEA